ncbi:Tn7-like element transposition protein TnsE [Desulfonatronum lacustre]|uniref:Tn7-like element transposition protein TnsE n=1 Tax=Desulfonatronum lacustre TaxID=66849 RepID=UPI0004B9DAAC|nr:Tn7-like element transposition protein TnsE [Desulfonatronum lacustre]
MKFKNVQQDSTITSIGSLFRDTTNSNWKINVGLNPQQPTDFFGISQIPALARLRVLNPTAEHNPAGFERKLLVNKFHDWRTDRINSSCIPTIPYQDKKQLCFIFKDDYYEYYLPQLELARVLFYHNAYLTRLSLIHQGLSQDFEVQRFDGTSEATVTILPCCSLPQYVREDHNLRRHLAWILTDDDARRSFESIYKYQLLNGYENDKYRRWNFQFDPPNLENAKLTFRGRYDKNSKKFLITEIHKILNINCNYPRFVEFHDPKFSESESGNGRIASTPLPPDNESLIDDHQEPFSDTSVKRINTPLVSISFTKPIKTTRIAVGKKRSAGCRNVDTTNTTSKAWIEEVSTDEGSILGTLRSADYDGLEDMSDDTHLYVNKFKLFMLMISLLLKMPNCTHVFKKIKKIRKIKRCSKHLLDDGNPRCLAVYFVKKNNLVYALIEVDTSDSKQCLSTLLLKNINSITNWNILIDELELNLLKNSLVWPTSFLNQMFGSNYKRISHPKTSSKKPSLDQDSIHGWAKRLYLEM